jgi:hypothetical protein
MRRVVFLAAVLVLIVPSFAEETKTLTGQVFIRTKGAETIKLSLVDVLLFEENPLTDFVARMRSEAQPLLDSLERAARGAFDSTIAAVEKGHDTRSIEAREKELDAMRAHIIRRVYLKSASYYFSDLPPPIQSTKTDADGNFIFKLPEGSYVLVAASQRRISEKLEFYNWMVKVAVHADKRVMLANDNLTNSGSADSLIATREIGDYPGLSLEGINLDSLKAEVELQKKEAELNKQKEMAQRKAVELYPDLGVAGSPLNKEFVDRVKRYQAEKKEFFAEPDWPIRLAKECSEYLKANPAAQ